MFILIKKTSYLVKNNIMQETWHICHLRRIVNWINVTNVIKINRSNMTYYDCNVICDDEAILK